MITLPSCCSVPMALDSFTITSRMRHLVNREELETIYYYKEKLVELNFYFDDLNRKWKTAHVKSTKNAIKYLSERQGTRGSLEDYLESVMELAHTLDKFYEGIEGYPQARFDQ